MFYLSLKISRSLLLLVEHLDVRARLRLDLDFLLAVPIAVQLQQLLPLYRLPLLLFCWDTLGLQLVVVGALGLATRQLHLSARLLGEGARDVLYLRHLAA